MKTRLHPAARRTGMTLLELLIAMGVGSLVLAVALTLTVFAARSFIALGNYSTLDQKSRLAADLMTREIRQATKLVAWSSNATTRSLTLTNDIAGYSIRYSWDSTSKRLLSRKNTEAADRELLPGCDDWTFSFWQRTPQPNLTNVFYNTTTPAECKLINMTWKCSRSVASTKLMNTETVQTAQIVLRNQTPK